MNLENFFRSDLAKHAIEKFREDHPSPAFSIALVKDGKVIDSILKRADIQTCGRIASMSKSFAAVSILMLRDEGKVTLHSVVKDILEPNTIHPRWHSITIHQLLSMTTPIVTDNDWADRYLDSDNQQYSEFFKLEPYFAPVELGPMMSYSNLAFMLIGRIISTVSGVDARDFITERLLKPLQMTRTFWHNPPESETNYLRGYRKVGEGWSQEATFEVRGDGAVFGGLWSSLSDLAIWVGFLASKENALLSLHHAPFSSEEFTSLATNAAELQHASYGYGLRTGIIGRRNFSGHSGALPGYGSSMRWDTKSGIGLVALANATYCPVWYLTRDLLAAAEFQAETSKPKFPDIENVGRQLLEIVRHWPGDEASALFSPNVYPDLTFEKIDREFRKLACFAQNAKIQALSFHVGEISFGEHSVLFTIAPVKPLAIQKLEFINQLQT